MHSIQIFYSIKPIIGKSKKKQLNLECASEWDELKRDQVELLMGLILHAEMDMSTRKTILLQKVSNIPLDVFHLLNPYQIMDIYDCVDVFFADPKLTRNLWNEVRINPPLNPLQWRGLPKRVTLVGPSDMFGNLTVDEFIEAEDHYFDYCEAARDNNQNMKIMEQILDRLIATLWREKDETINPEDPKWNGDYRVAFGVHQVKRRAALTSRLPLKVKMGMLFYYQGCRSALEHIHDMLFDSSEESAKDGADRETWIKMLGHLPNDKFGTLDQIGDKNLQTTLYFCNLFIKEAKEAKRKT